MIMELKEAQGKECECIAQNCIPYLRPEFFSFEPFLVLQGRIAMLGLGHGEHPIE